ncbi:MAG TPA: ABC transporter substrate-binding protein, partial [Acidimicrobiales bacterium]|nr:ABC transporter substrate-binding protein [Acidimicrobiales bacterium]
MRRSLLGIVAVGGLLLAACGDDDDSADTAPADEESTESTVAPATGSGSNIQASGECGAGTGEEATGEPIKIGAMATNIPGVDFTWITEMTGAYFECVNDNGGIDGRPIEYIAEEEQVDPQQISSLATKLVEQDQVLGIV